MGLGKRYVALKTMRELAEFLSVFEGDLWPDDQETMLEALTIATREAAKK